MGDQVEAVRNAHFCPSDNWWLPWLLAVIAVIVLLCCAAVVLSVLFGRGKKSRGSATRLDAQPEFNKDFLPPGPDENQLDAMPSQDYGNGGQDHQQDYRSDSRDMRMVEPGAPMYDSRDMREDSMLPPEPPRMDSLQQQQAQMWQDSYQPGQEPRQNPDLLAPISPSQSHTQDSMRNAYTASSVPRQLSNVPGSGSMRIPGLSEPQLLPGVQPLVIPGAAQMTPPDLLSQALPMQGQAVRLSTLRIL